METLETAARYQCPQLPPATAPIDRLPPELLCDIFWELLEWDSDVFHYSRSRDHYRTLNPLRLVSSSWLACIDNNPLFWTVAASEAPQHVFAEILNKSRQAPLHACYTERRSSNACLHMLLNEAYRWRGLFAVINTEEPTKMLFSRHTPLLKTIAVRTAKVLSEFQYDLHRTVEHVTWTGAGIPWAGFSWQDVRILRLEEIGSNCGPPTANEFLNILVSCPNLVELRLNTTYIGFSTTDTAHGISKWTVPISLPHLKTLILRSVDRRLVRLVLRTIVFPQNAQVSIWAPQYFGRVAKLIADRLMNPDETLSIAMPLVVHLNDTGDFEGSFSFGKTTIVYESGQNQWDEEDEEEDEDVSDPPFFDYMLQKIKPLDHPVWLKLDHLFTYDINDIAPKLRNRFPRTTTLTIVARPGHGVLGLALDKLLKIRANKWPFPDLHTMYLTDRNEGYDWIVDTISRRVKASQGKRSGVTKLAKIVLGVGWINQTSLKTLRDLGIQVTTEGTRIDEGPIYHPLAEFLLKDWSQPQDRSPLPALQ